MKICEIEIATTVDGETEYFQTKGELRRSGETREVCYRQENDFVTLLYDDLSFQMKRCGEANLACTFRLNARTAMLVSGYGGKGEIPVETSVYALQSLPKGDFIHLRYSLIFSDRSQVFQLKLKIETSEEK